MEAFVRVQQHAELPVWRVPPRRFPPVQPGRAYAGDLLTHKVLHNGHIHAAHTFLDLCMRSTRPRTSVPRVKRPRTTDALDVPKISTDASAAAGIWGKLRAIHADIGPARKLVLLNPNASDKFPMRRWPLESFTELARQLLEDPDVFVLITGVASEKPDAQHMCARLGSARALDLTGQTTMTELLHLFDVAHVLVTNDSGTGPLRGPDTDPRDRLLRAGGPRALSAAHVQRRRDPHGILLQPVHRAAQPAAVTLQRQRVPAEHQRRTDRRAGPLASRCVRCSLTRPAASATDRLRRSQVGGFPPVPPLAAAIAAVPVTTMQRCPHLPCVPRWSWRYAALHAGRLGAGVCLEEGVPFMSAGATRQAVEDLRDEVMRLLDRHRVLTSLASRSRPRATTCSSRCSIDRTSSALQRHPTAQHPADIAAILDSLPGDDRLLVFRQLDPEQAGASLVEATAATRGSLLQEIAREELVKVLLTLDADDHATSQARRRTRCSRKCRGRWRRRTARMANRRAPLRRTGRSAHDPGRRHGARHADGRRGARGATHAA